MINMFLVQVNGKNCILFIYYRAGWHRIQLYKLLSKAGFHVLTFDYRGNMFCHVILFYLLSKCNTFCVVFAGNELVC